MGWMHFVVVLVIFGSILCEDTKNEDYSEDNIRETRQYNQEGWRVSESFHKGSPDWIPRGEPPEQLDLKVKRRRLRKRKRKPQPIEDFSDEEEEVFIKRFHPQRLDQIREPLEEMDEEAARNPTIRRRITPVYYSPQSINGDPADRTPQHTDLKRMSQSLSSKSRTEPIMPITSSITAGDEKIQGKTETKVNPLAGLKSLLKKSRGNISLSEILQQRNLSLSELLNGGEHAISVLTEKPLAVTAPSKIVYVTDKVPNTNAKYKRLPPSVALTKTADRSYVQKHQSPETLTDEETLEAQRKRLTLLQSKENKLFSPLNRMEVITEPTTERRIFVTSNPKYFTSPQLLSESSSRSSSSPSTTTTFITTTTNTPKLIITTASETPKEMKTNKLINKEEGKNLPMTNAKLRLTTKKISVNEEKSSHLLASVGFPEPIKISINEILGFEYDKAKQKNNDAPMKVSIDLEEFIEENKANFETSPLEENTTAGVEKNQTYVTARKELMEVLEDPVSRDKLSRILENRNMTLNELVEQRERGSSQLHLADIFHNSTREPEPKEEPLVGKIMADSFQSFPVLTRQSKSRTFDEVIINKFLPINRSSEQPDVVTSRPEEQSSTERTETKAGVNAPETQPFPWKQLYPDIFPDSADEDAQSRENDLEEGLLSLDRLDNSLSLSSREQLKPDEYDLFLQIPPGVKSALFVSLAIVGLSLVVFLTLLVVFRWLQKKNRATNYCSSFSSKIGYPIIVKGHSPNSLRSFVGEKVRRKKNFFKSNMPSMTDEIWETSRDRKPSF